MSGIHLIGAQNGFLLAVFSVYVVLLPALISSYGKANIRRSKRQWFVGIAHATYKNKKNENAENKERPSGFLQFSLRFCELLLSPKGELWHSPLTPGAAEWSREMLKIGEVLGQFRGRQVGTVGVTTWRSRYVNHMHPIDVDVQFFFGNGPNPKPALWVAR